MMRVSSLMAALAAAVAPLHNAALADDAPAFAGFERAGYFLAVEGGGSFRKGTSGTTTGGVGNGGSAHDVSFDTAYVIAGKLGYQPSPTLGIFVSYDRIDGGVQWKVDFPRFAQFNAPFSGNAISDVILANVRYSLSLATATRLNLGAGAGVSFNRLTDIDEVSAVSGRLISHVGEGAETSFAARAAAGIEHDLTSCLSLGVNGSLDYYGDFETASVRTAVPSGIRQPIGSYGLDNVWGGTVTGTATLKF